MQLWKAGAAAFIVLGVYIILSFIFGGEAADKQDHDGYPYHLGCYDISNPLNNSQIIATYIDSVNHHLNLSSASEVFKVEQQLQKTVVTPKSANDIAAEF